MLTFYIIGMFFMFGVLTGNDDWDGFWERCALLGAILLWPIFLGVIVSKKLK